MACATLKRSLDWESVLGGRPAKRRRCTPFCSGGGGSSPSQRDKERDRVSPTAGPSGMLDLGGAFAPASASFSPTSSHAHGHGHVASVSSPSASHKTNSVFPDVVSKKFTPEYMAENIKAELKRMQKRRQLYCLEKMENSDSSSGGENSDSPSRSDRALFTFKQVGQICERMLRERESEIREEYDNVLTAKLAEQYDAFVKFTYDQIHKNYSSAPSYLS